MSVSKIDALAQAAVDTEVPGLAVAVVDNGELVQCAGYGFADLEWQNQATTDTVFRLGSLTKQFTAAAIMLLERDGLLVLDDPLATFLPDFPSGGHDVRVHHLLTHTSGIRSYTSIEGFFTNVALRDLSPAELIAVFQDEPFDFAPGSSWSYSNSGYVLLGAIVEQVSGTTYADFIRQRIFEPLGMERSSYLSGEPIVARRAHGYERDADGYRNAPFLSMTIPYAAGALGSTVLDLLRWETALREEQLFDRATLERIYTPVRLADGTAQPYGFGWGVETVNGHLMVHHGGGIPGFRTFMARFPERGAAVVVLGNCGSFEVEQLSWSLTKLIVDLA